MQASTNTYDLDDGFIASLDFSEHAPHIASKLGFSDAYCHPVFDHSGPDASSSASVPDVSEFMAPLPPARRPPGHPSYPFPLFTLFRISVTDFVRLATWSPTGRYSMVM